MTLLPHSRGGALARFFACAVLVIGFTAAATAVAGLLKVKDIVKAFDQRSAIAHASVTLPKPGAPETLLLIGSDHRAGSAYNPSAPGGIGNTDTMMLVRIDDSSSTINLMSIPRDLAVNIPGYGEQKLNAAYEDGGPNLLVKTMRHELFPDLQITHILDVNFGGFADLVNAIGCVYSDVDQRYYNVSSGITGDPNDFSSIDIQPGYQKLCGGNNEPNGALAFVRYRHTDSDEVRNARQQDFLRWARENYSVDQLVSNEQKLVDIFGDHVTTDGSLHTTDGIIDLFDVLVHGGHTLKTIKFPEYLVNCPSSTVPCYVYANGSGPQGDGQIGQPTAQTESAYHAFLTPTLSASAGSSSAHTGHHAKRAGISDAGLTADPGDGKSQAGQLEKLGPVGLPVLYPAEIQTGSAYCFAITANCDSGLEPQTAYDGSYPRKYVIHGIGDVPYDSYVMTLEADASGGVGANEGWFYTVQGTTWKHPPILKSPSKVITVAGRKLFEYEDGGKIALVAIHTARGAYWISNTLDNYIPNGQMVAIAASLTPAS